MAESNKKEVKSKEMNEEHKILVPFAPLSVNMAYVIDPPRFLPLSLPPLDCA
ncbi:hypothetical protein AAMO2058_000650000 [Amorphochlora amoebiformis]